MLNSQQPADNGRSFPSITHGWFSSLQRSQPTALEDALNAL
jgi:hypothetical protein